MKKGLVMGAHPRRGEDVGPEFLACDGAGGGALDRDRCFCRRTIAPFGDLPEKLGVHTQRARQFRETTMCLCVESYIHGGTI